MNNDQHPARRQRRGERPTEPLSFDDEAAQPVEAAGAVQEITSDQELWETALSHAAMYVEHHCVDGGKHAEYIMSMARPKFTPIATHPAEPAVPAVPAVPNQPVPGQLYDCTLEHCVTGDVRQALLLCVDEDDCTWRTADDHSELSNGWEVAAWSRAPSPVGGTLVAKAEPTDLSNQLRAITKDAGTGVYIPVRPQMLNAAAEEIERYYGGMVAWKQTAEKKDRDWNEARMRFESYKCEQRAAESAAAPAERGLVQALERIALNVSGDDPAQNIAGDALHTYRATQPTPTGEK